MGIYSPNSKIEFQLTSFQPLTYITVEPAILYFVTIDCESFFSKYASGLSFPGALSSQSLDLD